MSRYAHACKRDSSWTINSWCFWDEWKRGLSSHDPVTGKHLANIHYCDADDVARAVSAAENTYPAWRSFGQKDRVELINKLAGIGRRHGAVG